MPVAGTIELLANLPNVTISEGAPLSRYTRFGIGGPARIFAETADEASFMQALDIARSAALPWVVIGGGTNLIVSDAGFPGLVLRFRAAGIERDGRVLRVQAGAVLQDLVDFSIAGGLRGLETMTGIPGSTGAAIYGNAGAYGHSIDERIREVRYFDGSGVGVMDNAACRFCYRGSVFKQHKEWIIFSAELLMDEASPSELRSTADGILTIRLQKYPLDMKCAGSIFKNLILAELPESVRRQVPERVVREGKAPAAYFLEEIGAKGMRRGDIQVATYHANLIYNHGQGTAADLRDLILELKSRVEDRFGLRLEEEVQYVGF